MHRMVEGTKKTDPTNPPPPHGEPQPLKRADFYTTASRRAAALKKGGLYHIRQLFR